MSLQVWTVDTAQTDKKTGQFKKKNLIFNIGVLIIWCVWLMIFQMHHHLCLAYYSYFVYFCWNCKWQLSADSFWNNLKVRVFNIHSPFSLYRTAFELKVNCLIWTIWRMGLLINILVQVTLNMKFASSLQCLVFISTSCFLT